MQIYRVQLVNSRLALVSITRNLIRFLNLNVKVDKGLKQGNLIRQKLNGHQVLFEE